MITRHTATQPYPRERPSDENGGSGVCQTRSWGSLAQKGLGLSGTRWTRSLPVPCEWQPTSASLCASRGIHPLPATRQPTGPSSSSVKDLSPVIGEEWVENRVTPQK